MASQDEADLDTPAPSESNKTKGRQGYVWGDDEELTDYEHALKRSVLKRRERQKKAYRKKKMAKQRAADGSGSSQMGPGSVAGEDEPSSRTGHNPATQQNEQPASDDEQNSDEQQDALERGSAERPDCILDDLGTEPADNSGGETADSGAEGNPLVIVRDYDGY